MGRKNKETKEVRELSLSANSQTNPLIDFTDGGDFAILSHIDNIVGNEIVRAQMNVIVLCTKGVLHVNIHGKDVELHANEILICPSRIIVNKYDTGEECQIKAMCLSDRLVYNMLGDRLDVWIKTTYVNNVAKITLSETECKRMEQYCVLSRSIINDNDIPYRSDLVRVQLEALMLELCGRMSTLLDVQQAKTSYSKTLFYNFLKSLSSSAVKRKPVMAYANELAITPKYLSFICDKYSGNTALEWIDKFVMEDARYYLKNTNMPIKEIATLLGFPNNSFFGRYIYRHVGMSPIRYRRFLNN